MPDEHTWKNTLVETGGKALGLLATSGAFLGFVAVIGGAVTVVRLRAAQLPADQAVRFVPHEDLIVVGAGALGAFLFVAVVAVAGVYAIDGEGKATARMRGGLLTLVAAEVVIAIAYSAGSAAQKGVAIGVTVVLWGVHLLMTSGRDTCHGAIVKPARWTSLVGHVAATVGFAALLWFIFDWHRWWLPLSVLVAAGLAGICFGVARASGKRFWPYGLAVLFSVPVFGAVLFAARLYDEPKVNPVALIRQGNDGVSGVVGLFIARTDTTYWLGAVTEACGDDHDTTPRKTAGRIFAIPRDQVLGEEIGAPTSLDDARVRAPQLLSELVQRQPPGGAPPPSAADTPAPGDTAAVVPIASYPAVDVQPDVKRQPACATDHPTVVGVRPAVAVPGGTVEIRGYGFGDAAGAVLLGGVRMAVAAWTDTFIAFRVAAGARTAPVVVRTAGNAASPGAALAVADGRGPSAAISVTVASPRSRTFALEASASTASSGAVVAWEWRSAGRVIGRQPTAVYRLARRQRRATVSLTVTDAAYQHDTATRVLRPGVAVLAMTRATYFAVGATTLTAQGRRAISAIAARFAGPSSRIRRVVITGYADFLADATRNLELSRLRAETVREELAKALSVSLLKVDVRWVGETRAQATSLGDPRRAQDRRATLTVEYAGGR